jgi:tyrosine-protein kinase
MTEERSSYVPAVVAVLRVIRRRWPVLLICTLLVPAAAIVYSKRQEKEYTASAALLFRDPGFAQALFGSSVLSPSSDPTRDAATDIQLVTQRAVADATAKALGGGLTGDQIAQMVSASSEDQSDVVSISVRDHDPEQAAQIANAYARQFILLRQAADRAKLGQGEALLEQDYRSLSPADRAGPRGRGLQQQLDKLQTLASVQTGNAELTQEAVVPTTPSSPNTVRNGILGAMLGLLLGIAAAILFERLDRHVRDPKELREILGSPVLSTIPKSRSINRAAKKPRRLTPKDAEAFRMLRASLTHFDADSKVRSVLVTSPSAGEGKSTVAWNLAAAAAGAGARVLLIEADLRNPKLARRLPAVPESGLSELISGQAEFDQVLQVVEVPERSNGARPSRSMDVITAGAVPPNPVRLMESARMDQLIEQSERDYDLVVIDAGPTALVAEAVPLIKRVSGVIVVTRLGVTRRDAVVRLRDQLENLGASTLGLVVNGGPVRDVEYGYYRYGGSREAAG